MELVDELKHIIFLNKLEIISMTKEYFLVYLISLIKDFNGRNNRIVLIEKLKEFYSCVKLENKCIKYLLKNLDKVTNEKVLNEVLDDLDLLNEKTYLYFNTILSEYENNMYCKDLSRSIIPFKYFKTINENNKYLEEILGLTLNYGDLEEFYKDEKAFKFLKSKVKIIDSQSFDGMPFYGCYPQIDDKTKIVTDIKICVPKITDLKSMLINIHEFKHGIDIYPYIGSYLPNLNYECVARNYEEKFKTYLISKVTK